MFAKKRLVKHLGLKSKLVEMAKKEVPSCFHTKLSKLRPHSPPLEFQFLYYYFVLLTPS